MTRPWLIPAGVGACVLVIAGVGWSLLSSSGGNDPESTAPETRVTSGEDIEWGPVSAEAARAAEEAADAARAYLLAGEVGKARVVLDRAIQVTPGIQELHLVSADAWFDAGDYERAAESVERAIAIGPAHAEMYNAAGLYRKNTGELGEAIGHWRRAAALAPGDPRFPTQIASVMTQIQDWDGVIRESKKAIALDESLAQPHGMLASALVQTGRHQEALPSARLAVSREPKQWAYRLIEAQALMGLDDAEGASVTLLALPVESRRANALLVRTLADALEATGRTERAAEELLGASSIDTDGELRGRAGLLLVETGRLSEARAVARSIRFIDREASEAIVKAIEAADSD